MAKKLQPKIGDIVAFNTLADAVWFDVLAIDRFVLTIREHNKPNYASQWADRSMVKQNQEQVKCTSLLSSRRTA